MRKALLLIASLAVALGLAEVALRLAWENPFRAEGVDSVLRLRIHHPGMDLLVDREALNPTTPRVRFRTDERSYIRPSRRYSKPDLTIAFLGGSTTECRAVREDLRFPALASEILAGRGIRANTLNAARSGNTLHDSLLVLLNHVVSDRPDIAVLMHATNDTGVLARDGSYRSRMGQPVAPRNLAKWTVQLLSRRVQLAGLLRASLLPALRERDGGRGGIPGGGRARRSSRTGAGSMPSSSSVGSSTSSPSSSPSLSPAARTSSLPTGRTSAARKPSTRWLARSERSEAPR